MYNLKNVKNTREGVLLLLACNFTKSNTPPWMFFTFLKFYKWYQIAQNITNVDFSMFWWHQETPGCMLLACVQMISWTFKWKSVGFFEKVLGELYWCYYWQRCTRSKTTSIGKVKRCQTWMGLFIRPSLASNLITILLPVKDVVVTLIRLLNFNLKLGYCQVWS